MQKNQNQNHKMQFRVIPGHSGEMSYPFNLNAVINVF